MTRLLGAALLRRNLGFQVGHLLFHFLEAAGNA